MRLSSVLQMLIQRTSADCDKSWNSSSIAKYRKILCHLSVILKKTIGAAWKKTLYSAHYFLITFGQFWRKGPTQYFTLLAKFTGSWPIPIDLNFSRTKTTSFLCSILCPSSLASHRRPFKKSSMGCRIESLPVHMLPYHGREQYSGWSFDSLVKYSTICATSRSYPITAIRFWRRFLMASARFTHPRSAAVRCAPSC